MMISFSSNEWKARTTWLRIMMVRRESSNICFVIWRITVFYKCGHILGMRSRINGNPNAFFVSKHTLLPKYACIWTSVSNLENSINNEIFYMSDAWDSRNIIPHQVCDHTGQAFAFVDSGDNVNVERSQWANDMQPRFRHSQTVTEKIYMQLANMSSVLQNILSSPVM